MTPEIRKRYRVWGNAVWFQLTWFAAVFGAVAGTSSWAVAVLVCMLVWSVAFGGSFAQDLRMGFVGLLVAFTLEPVWMGADLLHYALQPPYIYPPLWIVCLWVGFAICFNHCLAWLSGRYALAAALGAVGSVFSITAAERAGAVAMPSGWLAAAIAYAIPWAFLTPAFAWFPETLRRRAAGEAIMSKDKPVKKEDGHS